MTLEGDAEVEAGCVQWGTQLDTESEDEVDLRWLRPPNMVHDAESIVPHDGAACHRVQRPTPDRVWHNSGQFIHSFSRLLQEHTRAHQVLSTHHKAAQN